MESKRRAAARRPNKILLAVSEGLDRVDMARPLRLPFRTSIPIPIPLPIPTPLADVAIRFIANYAPTNPNHNRETLAVAQIRNTLDNYYNTLIR